MLKSIGRTDRIDSHEHAKNFLFNIKRCVDPTTLSSTTSAKHHPNLEMASANLFSMLLLFLIVVFTEAAPAVGPVVTLSPDTEPIVQYPTPTLDVRRHSSAVNQTTTSVVSPTIPPTSTQPVTTTTTSSYSSHIVSKTAVPGTSCSSLLQVANSIFPLTLPTKPSRGDCSNSL